VPPVFPVRLILAAEPQPGFVHERRRLQGLPRRFVRHLGRGQPPQLTVDERKDLIRGHGIAALDSMQQQGHVTRR
jgi:hypothetical protein